MKSVFRLFVFSMLCLSVSLSSGAAMELGLQAYTFRKDTFAEMLDKAAAMQIRNIQAFRGQRISAKSDAKFNHNMNDAAKAEVLALLKARNMTLTSYGVITGKDEADWRKIFAFAKEMGLRDIATEPEFKDMPLVAQLSSETGINVAIHNHPRATRYFDPDVALGAAKPYGKNVGLCADTGHWVRSGFDAVATLKKVEGRIQHLHFKDLSESGVRKTHDMPWGTGVSNAAGQILELRRQGFDGIVYMEYEYISPLLDSEADASAEYFRRAIAASDEDLRTNSVLPVGHVSAAAVNQNWEGKRGSDSARWLAPVSLFGEKLSDAEYEPGTWVLDDDGVITAKGGGNIWTKKTYDDFALNLEFRCETKTNSGIFFRCTDTASPAHNAIEVQILQGSNPDNKRIVGAIYDINAPAREIEIEPGQWYHFTIVAKGPRVLVYLDGECVNDINLNRWKKVGENPDGTPNKFKKAFSELSRSGRIGLQYHGKPVSFRNLHIEPAVALPRKGQED